MKKHKKRKKTSKRFKVFLDILKWFAITVLEYVIGYLLGKFL